MGLKVLKGKDYTMARLAGIMHEGWCMKLGRQPGNKDTIYGEGRIVINVNTQEIGLLCNTEHEHHCLPDIHKNRLTDVNENDGWIITNTEV